LGGLLEQDVMKILIDLASLRRVRWYEHLARFVLGGVVSVLAGLIAKEFGPTIGGLFLAFPAIFPASALFLDKHEREKKQKAGVPATIRGRLAVGLDARGAALGAIALGAFAFVIWKMLPHYNAAAVLAAAFAVWITLAIGLWRLRRLHVYLTRRKRFHGSAG
jgi:hypothetical protein